MKKQILVIAVLLFSSAALFSQEQYPPNVLQLISRKGIIIAPNVVIDTIIDNRVLKSADIGKIIVDRGIMGHEIESIYFENDFINLKNYLNGSIENDKDAFKISMIVNKFSINEVVFLDKKSSKFTIDIVLSKKDSSGHTIELVKYNDEIFDIFNLNSNIKYYPKTTTTILNSVFSALNSENIKQNNVTLIKNYNINNKNILANKDSLKVGFYKSFNDFYHNETTLKWDYDIKTVPPEPKNNLITLKKQSEDPCFGFSDGVNIYIQTYKYETQYENDYNYDFAKVVTFGRYILMDYNYDHVPPAKPGVGVAVGASFGLIGGLIGGLADATVANNNFPFGNVIDMETGSVSMLSRKTMLKILEPYPDIKTKYEKMSDELKDFKTRKAFIDKINQIELEKKLAK